VGGGGGWGVGTPTQPPSDQGRATISSPTTTKFHDRPFINRACLPRGTTTCFTAFPCSACCKVESSSPSRSPASPESVR